MKNKLTQWIILTNFPLPNFIIDWAFSYIMNKIFETEQNEAL